jgi:hypothetical protein
LLAAHAGRASFRNADSKVWNLRIGGGEEPGYAAENFIGGAMQIRNKRDFWSGIMFGAFGLIFVGLSQQYTLGSAAKMGPGYFPTALGLLLTFLGAMIVVAALRSGQSSTLAKIGWRELVLVLLSVILFALILPKLGFALALIVLLLVAGLASFEFKFRDTMISVVFLGVLCWVVFIKGLELQFPLLPTFLSN